MRRSFESQIWGSVICSVPDGTRPNAAMGTAITPHATPNTMGSYSQVIAGATVTDDVFAIGVNINSVFQSANARDSLFTIGLDPAGGSSFTDWIGHLSGANAVNYGAFGFDYWFPVGFRAGTAVGAKMQQNHATPATGRIMLTLFCRPRVKVRSGSYVRTFGVDTANSRGTIVTQGMASEGAWTQLGTAIADRELWYWEFGVGCNNATMGAASIHCDIGVGDVTNKKLIVNNGYVSTAATENMTKSRADGWGCGVSGDLVYGRAQSSGTADANFSMLAYGVGG